MSLPIQNGCAPSDGPNREKTIRERIAYGISSRQEEVARFAKLEHTIPSHWLDMTPYQIWEKFGFSIHF